VFGRDVLGLHFLVLSGFGKQYQLFSAAVVLLY